MLQMKISSIVEQIVRHELGQGSGRADESLYLNFDLRMNHYVVLNPAGRRHETNLGQSRGLHLLYHSNPGSTYITVFSAVTDSPFAKISDVTKWKYEGSHDSCWRYVDVFAEVYFDMAAKINEEIVAWGGSEVPPKDMHEWHNFGGHSGRLFQWVKTRVTKDPSNSYLRRVELI